MLFTSVEIKSTFVHKNTKISILKHFVLKNNFFVIFFLKKYLQKSQEFEICTAI